MDYKKYFEETAEPASEERIAEIEKALGRELPQGYKELLAQTGGGQLKRENSYIHGIVMWGQEIEACCATDIYGNGELSYRDLNLAHAAELAKRWEFPEGVLFFADTEASMHVTYVINYEVPDFPVGSILYLDNEQGNELGLAANSVEEFFELLGPNPFDEEWDDDD